MQESEPRLQTLRTLSRQTDARARLNDAAAATIRWLPVPLFLAVVALVLMRLLPPHSHVQGVAARAAWATLGLVIVYALAESAAMSSELRGARLLDLHYRLADRLTNALQFARVPASERTGMMRAAMGDAFGRLAGLSPSAAEPLRAPPGLGRAAALALALGGAYLLPAYSAPPPTATPVATVPTVDAMVLHPEDLELLQQAAAKLDPAAGDPAAQAAKRAFRQLVEDVRAERLSREELFRKLDQIQRSLAASAELEEGTLDEALRDRAAALEESRLVKPLAKSLREGDLGAAQKALRELAQRLKARDKTLSKAELERLREAFAAASKASEERIARIDEERARIESAKRRLLKKKSPAGALSTADKNEARKMDRQLKRLDRKKKQAERAQQALSKLDGEIAAAAQDLLKEMEKSGRSLDDGAQALEELDQQKLSDKEKQEVLKQLEQMRKLLQQQRKEGKDERQKRLDQFRERARGAARKRRSGGPGSQPGQLTIRPSDGAGTSVNPPGGPTQPGTSQAPGQGANGKGGDTAGDGKGDKLRGEASSLAAKTHDVAAAGLDSGQGDASSEIVFGAAEEGFAAAGYRQIHAEYETVAEEVLAQDEIPPGYRFYVRRYFQLIRPRSE